MTNECLEMVSWVRDDSTDVYCECFIEYGCDNMNEVETSHDEILQMAYFEKALNSNTRMKGPTSIMRHADANGIFLISIFSYIYFSSLK